MKAKLKGTTGIFFDVTEVDACVVKDSIPFVRYFADDDGNIYDEQQLEFESEFLPDTPEKVIVGWVLRDDNNRVGIYLNKPTCDEDGDWDLTGKSYELSRELFPDITPESEPKKYRITITPME